MKKVRVTVPEDIYRIMRNDMEDFGVNNNKLCNYILDKFKFKREYDTEALLLVQGRALTKMVQFDLNVNNKDIYYDILRENKIEVEAEFFRELFKFYTSKYKYERELFIFEDIVKSIMEAIKNKNRMKIRFDGNLYTVEPFFIKRDEQGDENFLFSYVEEMKEYKNFKLKELQVIGVLNDKIPGKDRKYVENIRKNFDPFLADGNKVKVQLTENGEKLLKSLTNYRPKLLKKEKDFFIFEASNENAKLYFRQFFKDAVIIEPIELREELKKELEDLLNEYRK
ncbi:MAG: WYL domain-containing protein [Fusobacteriaceae bacterium]|nr:WYL domain-containing protein [Fusobacteriaceae bacterium]MBP6466821.1 WYL domain-containing protein [Fusobacteriaceae bacterium]MBU9918001.1 WYL domain-containing protein [Fusobacteriaceae bacterium]